MYYRVHVHGWWSHGVTGTRSYFVRRLTDIKPHSTVHFLMSPRYTYPSNFDIREWFVAGRSEDLELCSLTRNPGTNKFKLSDLRTTSVWSEIRPWGVGVWVAFRNLYCTYKMLRDSVLLLHLDSIQASNGVRVVLRYGTMRSLHTY